MSKFQIIIPMSGFGERFRQAGYQIPKPLIQVDGKPIIAHVIDLFPDETNFIFICNQEHLDNPNYKMEKIIRKYCPTGQVIGIPSHRLGPVHAVSQIVSLLDPELPVIVNYCDFTCLWDWPHFKSFVSKTDCDGAIPAYKGFHPHALGVTNYAYLKEMPGDSNGKEIRWLLDIQEKKPFTDNRMCEYASSGTYYFASAKIMSDAFTLAMHQNLNVNGEYYVSLAFKPMLAEDKKIAIYPLQYFMQWGTPEDLNEYIAWSNTFKALLNPKVLSNPFGSLVIPMAGFGKRYADEGYALTKPLIPVFGKAMALQAIDDLPRSQYQSLVLRSDMLGLSDIEISIINKYPSAIITRVPRVTEGQACTALIGLNALESLAVIDDLNLGANTSSSINPITFGACDNGVLFDQKKYQNLLDNPDVDVIVWGVRGHANAIRNPQMFGWIDAYNDGEIQNISVKTPLSSPSIDPIVIGTFTFKKASDARRAIEALIARNGSISGEFYLDSSINDALALGLRCHLFEVDSFISWGTPNDLKTFEYWQSCFHKWSSHPYRIELDSRVEKFAIPYLLDR